MENTRLGDSFLTDIRLEIRTLSDVVTEGTPKQRKCLPIANKIRATKKILEEMKRIIRECDQRRYPGCEIGTCLKENRREIRWPGVSVRMDCVVGDMTTGATEVVDTLNVYARVVPLAKRFRVLERHPLIFLTASDIAFENLIKCIGEHVMFKVSKSVPIRAAGGGGGEKVHAFTVPARFGLEWESSDDDYENSENEPLTGFYLEMDDEGGRAKSV